VVGVRCLFGLLFASIFYAGVSIFLERFLAKEVSVALGEAGVYMDHGFIEALKRIGVIDLGELVGIFLRGHDRASSHITAGWHRDANDLSAWLNDRALANAGFKDKGLHPNEDIILDIGWAVHLRLMCQRDTFPDIDCIVNSIDLISAANDGSAAIVDRLQGMNDHTILDVRVITDKERLPFIATDRGKGSDEDILTEEDVADHARERIDIGRLVEFWLLNVRVKPCVDVGSHQWQLQASIGGGLGLLLWGMLAACYAKGKEQAHHRGRDFHRRLLGYDALFDLAEIATGVAALGVSVIALLSLIVNNAIAAVLFLTEFIAAIVGLGVPIVAEFEGILDCVSAAREGAVSAATVRIGV
jgi:hypothetical protein